MDWIQAAGWGAAGALATGVLALMSTVATAGYRWPWARDELVPRLFVLGGGVLVGAVVAAAAHSQISGPWPAFIIGASAPAVIRSLLSGVEVDVRLPAHEQERETQIKADAESLAKAREPSRSAPSPRVSADLADILDARREELAGKLPVVRSSDEGGEASDAIR
jgi:uncharacterized membrane protein YfcA